MSTSSKQRRPSPSRPQSGAARRAAGAAARAKTRRRRYFAAGAVGLAVIAGVVTLAVVRNGNSANTASGSTAAIGRLAPNGTLSTISGATLSVDSLRGRPTLLWFVTTWCSSCQAGTPAMASALSKFAARHVRVVEVENYQDLGQSGPSMGQFARALAGREYTNSDWTFGTASQGLTEAYNAPGNLDIYYLLDAKGRVIYVNSSPGSTMPQLLAQVDTLGKTA